MRLKCFNLTERFMKNQIRLLILAPICFFAIQPFFSVLKAQLERERTVTVQPVRDVFPASSSIGLHTVRLPSSGNLNSSIAHLFGPLNGGIERFFGLDDGANTRIGLEYGLSDRASIGIGRMTFNKVVDLSSKFSLFRQTSDGSTPVSLAIRASTGISTVSGAGLEFSERLSYLFSAMAARKMTSLSFQLSPMIAHFNNPFQGNPSRLAGLGIIINYDLNDRFTLSADYLPVFGNRNEGTQNAGGVSLNILTGGHVFQVFISTSQWHGEQYIMATNRDGFFDGEFRFGFNIHRVFNLKR